MWGIQSCSEVEMREVKMVFLLLELGNELFLAVQLVSQVADLSLVGLSVGHDLLLHGFLDRIKRTTGSSSQLSTYDSRQGGFSKSVPSPHWRTGSHFPSH